MHSKGNSKGRATVKSLAGASAILAAAVYGVVGSANRASADVFIDVGFANAATTTTTTGSAGNGNIVPVTYTPVQVTVPDAPGQTYDAANVNDPGTIWNSIESVSTVPTVSVSSVLYQQNLALVDSGGSATTAELNVTALEGAGKTDAIHNNSTAPGTLGTDGLAVNPANSSYSAGNGNGYVQSNVQRLLMGNNFAANGTGDGMQFEVTGLTPGDAFTLYVYGAGTADGAGGTFTLAAGNGGGSATTNSTSTSRFLSVFDGTGTNPTPEEGLSWNLLTGTVDGSGDITLTVRLSTTGVKAATNGFQLDLAPVPEPASLGLLALGGIGLLARRKRAPK